MNEGAALRVLSFLNDTSQRHLATLANEKRKVTVIGEEHEPDELKEEEEEEIPLSPVIDTEENLLTPEQVKEFFKAAENGAIERLDELFDTINYADPNMTNYTESLLMAAIRAKRRKVAEYLIDQLGINVNYNTDFIEFRIDTTLPIREQTISCRDLAYDRGMMDLVDLIDIISDEVKPSVKRYLQRRIKARLNEIHQAYLKRTKERNHRLIIQKQEKENQLLEDDELEKENEEASIGNTTDNVSVPPSSPPLPTMIRRSYKSHIEEAIQKNVAKNDKSIDETGKKAFRFSNYTVRYRLVEATNPKLQSNEKNGSKSTPFSLPLIPPIIIQPLSRPTTTTSIRNNNRRSISEISTRLPVREARTSTCRSPRHITTQHVASSVTTDNKPEIKPSVTTSINTTQRLLPKRNQQIHRDYGYIPQVQHTVYNEPRRSVPVTLKATAIGLPSDTRLIRD